MATRASDTLPKYRESAALDVRRPRTETEQTVLGVRAEADLRRRMQGAHLQIAEVLGFGSYGTVFLVKSSASVLEEKVFTASSSGGVAVDLPGRGSTEQLTASGDNSFALKAIRETPEGEILWNDIKFCKRLLREVRLGLHCSAVSNAVSVGTPFKLSDAILFPKLLFWALPAVNPSAHPTDDAHTSTTPRWLQDPNAVLYVASEAMDLDLAKLLSMSRNPSASGRVTRDQKAEEEVLPTRLLPWTAFRLTSTRIRRIMYRLLSALASLHAMGVAHRDVHPGNILLKVGDPSLAQKMSASPSFTFPTDFSVK
jgi:serine/threonine protein kinase